MSEQAQETTLRSEVCARVYLSPVSIPSSLTALNTCSGGKEESRSFDGRILGVLASEGRLYSSLSALNVGLEWRYSQSLSVVSSPREPQMECILGK